MATRSIVPRGNDEGGLGSSAKKWANVWATLVNALTLTAQATGFTISGGTTSKTLTVSDNANVSGTNTGDQTGGTPALTLGTANTAGASTNFIRRDDTILAFDATVPSTQALGDSAATGSATVAARRDHKHAMPAFSSIVAASISDGDTTHAPDGNSVFDALALKAPLASPTFTGTPAAPAPADNTSTTQLATTAFAKSQDAVLARLPDQAVNMTYAASGSSGIQVADNNNIDFGTGNFTLVWRGSLPDWTTSLAPTFFLKHQDISNRWGFYLSSTGAPIYFHYKSGGTSVTATGTILPPLTDKTTTEIVVVVTRETATIDGSVGFYFNGLLLQTITIPQGTPVDISNSGILYLMVSNASTVTHLESVNHFAATYNRALSATEVLDLYRNGIAYADQWGSQTPVYTSDFSSGVDGWDDTYSDKTGNQDSITDGVTSKDDCMMVVANNTIYCNAYKFITSSPIGKTIRFSCDVYVPSTNVTGKKIRLTLISSAFGAPTQVNYTVGNVWTTLTWEGKDLGLTGIYPSIMLITEGNSFNDITVGDKFYVKNVVVNLVGATLALEPEGIQPSPGQWLDSSTNKLHALQPATGSSLTRQKKTFEIRWTNTWSGTHEAQYISGVNQAVLPPNCYIESIVGKITGTTIEDIIIGDGSDTDRWVAITTGLAAGTVSFTLANRISDGPNYKMVVDPDANFTGSIEWMITGRILS